MASPGLALSRLWASEDAHEDETKKFKVAGPASRIPGLWLAEGLADCLLTDERNDLTQAEEGRYQRLREVQSAFIGVRHHGQHSTNGVNSGWELNLSEEELADDLAEEPEKDVEQYSFEITPQAGMDEVIEPTEEDELAALVDVSEADTKFEVSTVGDAVGDRLLDAVYLMWIADPTTQPAFVQALYEFAHARMGMTTVATKLWMADAVDDAASDFVLTMMNTLQRMRDGRGRDKNKRQIDGKACHYIYAALAEKRKGLVADLAEYQKNHVSDTVEGDDGDVYSLIDDHMETAHVRYKSEPDAEYSDDVMSARKAQWRDLIQNLPLELQPVARLYFLHGLTQKQVANETGLSQGAVSKQKTRIEKFAADYVAKTQGSK
jgi:RNA polymerase sigma factor (sigma-70 family)